MLILIRLLDLLLKESKILEPESGGRIYLAQPVDIGIGSPLMHRQAIDALNPQTIGTNLSWNGELTEPSLGPRIE